MTHLDQNNLPIQPPSFWDLCQNKSFYEGLTSPNILLFKCQLFNYLMNSEDTVRKLRNQTLKFLLIPPFWISKSKKSVQFFQKYHFFQTDIWKYKTVGVPNLKECKVLLVYCIKIKNVTFWNACYSRFFEFQNLKKSSNLFKTAILASQ